MEKRNESATAHITGGSSGLSASNKKTKWERKTPTEKKSSKERRRKDLPYAFIGGCIPLVVSQTSDGIDFQGTGYGEPYFSTLPFQVFV